MPELTVTEEQERELESIREDLADAYVDGYAHVRTEDVVAYLLDTYTPPGEEGGAGGTDYERIASADYTALQRVAADVDEVPGSGLGADEMRGTLLAELGAEEFAARLAEATDDAGEENEATAEDGADGPSAGEDADGTDTDESVVGGADAGSASAVANGPTGDDAGGGDADDGSTDVATASPGPDLSMANRLLREHDDKWRESGGDEPYEVDMPDGSTEGARTKDDVRSLLFRNY